MNYFINFVLFMIIILFYYKQSIYFRESFDPNNKHTNIILLGDSILKNDNYVDKNKNVEHILSTIFNGKIYNYARDNATIFSIYYQINSISNDLNNKNTHIFISIGGNDILNNPNILYDNYDLEKIIDRYKNALQNISIKFNNCQIYLLNIYYPKNNKYEIYKNITSKWNDFISSYAKEHNFIAVNISTIMNHKQDFVYDIEPSSIGSEKIAQSIINNLTVST